MNQRLQPGYTGYLRKENGKIVGVLRDHWGWPIRLSAKPSSDGGYDLTGELGEPPPDFYIPLVDDEQWKDK